MVQREQQSEDIPDPCFVQLWAVDGKCFYLQPGTMEVLRDQPLVQPTNGGLLCEELGKISLGVNLRHSLTSHQERARP